MLLVYCCGFRLNLASAKKLETNVAAAVIVFRDKFYSCVLYLVPKSDFSVSVQNGRRNEDYLRR